MVDFNKELTKKKLEYVLKNLSTYLSDPDFKLMLDNLLSRAEFMDRENNQNKNNNQPLPSNNQPNGNKIEQYADNYQKFHPEDSPLWIDLITFAAFQSKELAEMLQYLRGTGCILIPHQTFGYVIKPVIGNDGWRSQEEYDREKKCLNQYGETLINLLVRLKRPENNTKANNSAVNNIPVSNMPPMPSFEQGNLNY